MHNPPSDDNASPRVRPLSVWFISGWYFVSGLFSINMIVLVQSRIASAPVPAADVQAPLALGLTDILLAAFLIAVNMCGAGFLFFLNKTAVAFFKAAVLLNVAVNLWYLSSRSMGEQPAVAIVGVVLGWLVAVGVWRHAEKLAKAGILR